MIPNRPLRHTKGTHHLNLKYLQARPAAPSPVSATFTRHLARDLTTTLPKTSLTEPTKGTTDSRYSSVVDIKKPHLGPSFAERVSAKGEAELIASHALSSISSAKTYDKPSSEIKRDSQSTFNMNVPNSTLTSPDLDDAASKWSLECHTGVPLNNNTTRPPIIPTTCSLGRVPSGKPTLIRRETGVLHRNGRVPSSKLRITDVDDNMHSWKVLESCFAVIEGYVPRPGSPRDVSGLVEAETHESGRANIAGGDDDARCAHGKGTRGSYIITSTALPRHHDRRSVLSTIDEDDLNHATRHSHPATYNLPIRPQSAYYTPARQSLVALGQESAKRDRSDIPTRRFSEMQFETIDLNDRCDDDGKECNLVEEKEVWTRRLSGWMGYCLGRRGSE